MRYFFIIILLSAGINVFSQKHDYNWIFSSRWSDSISLITFDYGAKHRYEYNPNNFYYTSTNSTMSDNSGELLFSTNGCEVIDRNMNLMENGDNINPGEYHENNCRFGYVGGHQSCLTLPHPEDTKSYFIFHQTSTLDKDSNNANYFQGLYYSIVDFNSSSTGIVSRKNIELIGDSTIYGSALTAVKHSNNLDWWIINAVRDKGAYYTWLFKSDTILGPFHQTIGNANIAVEQISGGSQFTPDGSKYIWWNEKDGLFIMDFDRASGTLSNFKYIDHVIDTITFVGLAVSPNSRFLYTSAQSVLYQYDLWASDIESSRTVVGIYDGFRSPSSCKFWAGQLGPDCKIYFNSRASCSYIHVIHNPNKKGLACDLRQHDLSIKSNHFGTMPHFPNYRLGSGMTCDSTLVATVSVLPVRRPEVQVIPNPNRGQFHVETNFDYNSIELFDSQGLVHQITSDNQFRLDDAPPGLYLLIFKKNNQIIHTSKVVISGE